MHLIYRSLFPALWALWVGYWWIASWNVKRTLRRESLRARALYAGPLTIAALLLTLPAIPIAVRDGRFVPATTLWFWVGATLTASGLLFSVWARRHLGANWSGSVTIKHDHELICSGPYAFVRHPIYSGLLLAFFGCALARGEWWTLLAVLFVLWSLWWKLRIEEKWMTERFGDAYTVYRNRVAALIPFVW